MADPITVTWEQVRDDAGATDAKRPQLEACLALARAVVTEYLGAAIARVPDTILNRAVLGVAVQDYHRTRAPQGQAVTQFETSNGGPSATPIRISRDPLAPAYKLIERYVIGLG